jgi:hypothetical protein
MQMLLLTNQPVVPRATPIFLLTPGTHTSGTDFHLKKHSNQRGDFVDSVLRVRCTSIAKMVNVGKMQERLKVSLAFVGRLRPGLCPLVGTRIGSLCWFLASV